MAGKITLHSNPANDLAPSVLHVRYNLTDPNEGGIQHIIGRLFLGESLVAQWSFPVRGRVKPEQWAENRSQILQRNHDARQLQRRHIEQAVAGVLRASLSGVEDHADGI